jgi:nicotinamidase-related amidase
MMSALLKPIPPNAVHLCLDMQRLLKPEGPWPIAWAESALENVIHLCEARAARTLFTRFIPPKAPSDANGRWQQYFMRWREVTRDIINPELLDLLAPLEKFSPPARVIDKSRYSAFFGTGLTAILGSEKVDTLVITGAETDVCVLSTICAAVDLGYRIVLVSDGVCSSSDKCHDALMTLYFERFSQHLELADAALVIRSWE